MECPNCKEHTFVIAERKGVEIDHFPEGRGIWLDRIARLKLRRILK